MADPDSAILSTFSDSRMVGALPEPLRAYALAKCLEAVPYLEAIPTLFEEYTDHGVVHSCKVLVFADKLLAKNKLSKWEILILVLSSFYHDIGMSCTPGEWEALEAEPRFQREYRYIKDLILPASAILDRSPDVIEKQVRIEYLRRHHGERCQDWIAKELPPERSDALVENVYVWELVSWVCVGHTLSFVDLQGSVYSRSYPVGMAESVDVRLLTCLLRLADLCHLSRDRALPYMRRAMSFKSGLSEKIWEAVGDIAGVDCDKDRAVISVAAQPRTFERHRMISSFIDDIEAELRNSQRLLSDPGGRQLPWRFVDAGGVRSHPSAKYLFEPNARFRLIQDKIVRLLMGSKLYADPLYALRECLQNSVDAIRLYKLRDASSVGRIVVQYRIRCDSPVLDIFDNGTGMDRTICLQHLLSVGSDPFAASERRYQDWGGSIGDDIQLIAQHGIGFLSCFMLADKVEVFSKYPEAQRVHLILDSPTWLGEFRTTEECGFPQWSSATLSESTPWNERHGTCVRLHLRAPITKYDLMSFLSQNVLRIGERVVVVYEDDSVELVDVWGPNREWSFNSSENSSLAGLRKDLFLRKERGGLGGAPRDSSLEEVIESRGGARGIVRLKVEQYESSRLSQEGFLIRDGAANLLGTEAGSRREGDFPFYFDLDITGNSRFELDAERARIVDPEGCLTAEVLSWIEERGLRSIESIQSSLYFMCGENYYHGGIDLLVADDARVIAFHEILRAWYSPERIAKVLDEGKFDAFLKAKIFTAIGESHNAPLSLEEALEDQYFVLVPLVKLPAMGFDEDLVDVPDEDVVRMKGAVAGLIIEKVAKLAQLDKVIVLPNFPKAFSLPLSIVFRFEWIEVARWALLGRLIKREAWKVPEADLIEEKFKEVGGFMDSKLFKKSISARRKLKD